MSVWDRVTLYPGDCLEVLAALARNLPVDYGPLFASREAAE